jgi:hypothetical protein
MDKNPLLGGRIWPIVVESLPSMRAGRVVGENPFSLTTQSKP